MMFVLSGCISSPHVDDVCLRSRRVQFSCLRLGAKSRTSSAKRNLVRNVGLVCPNSMPKPFRVQTGLSFRNTCPSSALNK
eukprot:3746907-Pyramimonas_sp.AAC.1